MFSPLLASLVMTCAGLDLTQSPPASASPSPTPTPLTTAAPALDETVVVTAAAVEIPLRNAGRSLTMVTRADLVRLPSRSLVDAFRLDSSVETRARGAFGETADFQIRGASFGQTLVLIDGVRVNDAQSGHHNADFPVTSADVERIEVLHGPGSSLFGADAFGGVLNVVTRSGTRDLVARGGLGSFGQSTAALSAGGTKDRTSYRASGEFSESNGFRADRDYTQKAASFRLDRADTAAPRPRTTVRIGAIDKEFGADGYYGPAPSREWTKGQLATLTHRFGKGASDSEMRPFAVTGFYRHHSDHYIYDRTRPNLSNNRHTTNAGGLTLRGTKSLAANRRVSGGFDFGTDRVTSSNLGNHHYDRAAVFTEWQLGVGRSLIYPGIRVDAYSEFGTAVSPALALARPVGRDVAIRASLGRAFRVPTYTELYYSDPNNLASSDLVPESAWSTDLGVAWAPSPRLRLSASAFDRWDDSVIDWVRETPREKWRTQNLRDVTTRGVELRIDRSLASGRLSASYTRLTQTSGVAAPLSKYVLDFARDSFVALAHRSIGTRATAGATMNYKRRADGRSYWLADARLTRAIGAAEFRLDGLNLFDTNYQEIRGVAMPGRSVAVSVAFLRK